MQRRRAGHTDDADDEDARRRQRYSDAARRLGVRRIRQSLVVGCGPSGGPLYATTISTPDGSTVSVTAEGWERSLDAAIDALTSDRSAP